MASISGRMANLFSRYAPALGRMGTKKHVERYRSSKGKKGARLHGAPVFLLDVKGRTSGEPRPVMLILTRHGDDIVVTGSNGGNPETPNWYRNLVADDDAHVEFDGERWAVSVRELDDGPERDRAWQTLVDVYSDFASYQELTDRKLPVAVLQRRT